MNDVGRVIDAWPEPQKSIARSVRKIVLEAGDGLKEGVKWGTPTFFGAKNVCSLMCHEDHVNLQLFQGARLEDPDSVLEGSGKGMRHMKFRSKSEVHKPVIERFVRQAVKLQRG